MWPIVLMLLFLQHFSLLRNKLYWITIANYVAIHSSISGTCSNSFKYSQFCRFNSYLPLFTLAQASDNTVFIFYRSVRNWHKLLDFDQKGRSGLGSNLAPFAPQSYAMLTAVKQFLKCIKNGKTANFTQIFPKMAICNFCKFDRSRFKQKRL